ncbi:MULTISPECIES: enoyl-CoA hydratase-related protein [Phyllobacteriaceae]|uniref:Enoyl-CoA hydratase-related protein n=1 Tax=Aquibium pacificus TaxID=3153579 RepID=A0ABV3SSY8_9HYPH|nr:enoyl-CoA hydratase-related protein [Mesorhizobium sp. J428]MCR5860267.1 enoyl-CoA hydratase-related protein [Mesorhizobium sp. J428]
MSDSLVLLDTKDRVATITINNAEKRNPLNLPTVEALIDALEAADADDEVLVIVLTGAGDRAFCAGGDLKAGADGGPFTGDISQPGHFVIGLFSLMEKCNKPIIGRINGHAMGGGSGLVCACDIAVMASTAKIATPEVKIGLFPMMIMPQMMRVIPRRRLLEMYITGEPWTAEQALEYGIVNYVTEPDALDAKVNELTSLITTRSPSAVRLGKYSYHAMQDMTIEQQFRFAETMLPRIAMTQDAREGFSAFIEKRVPDWTGR